MADEDTHSKRPPRYDRYDLLLALLALPIIASEFARTYPGGGLWDFGSFLESGRAAQNGLNPYGIYPLTLHVVLPGFETWNPNLNPPITALLFQLFDLADPHLTFRIWYGVSLVLYATAVALLARRYAASGVAAVTLVALALAGFWDTLLLGQIYVPLVLATVAAWLLMERGALVWAGLLIGAVIAIKPNFLVWPVLLLLSGYWRPALASFAAAAAISAIPLLTMGDEVYRQWLDLIASDSERAFFLTNASLSGLAARAGVPLAGLALSLALLAGAACWALLTRRRTVLEVSAISLAVALLASPLAWIHYTLFLLPVLFWKSRLKGVRIAMALLMVPMPFIIGQFGRPWWIQLTVGSLYNWALLLLFMLLVADDFWRSGLPGWRQAWWRSRLPALPG